MQLDLFDALNRKFGRDTVLLGMTAGKTSVSTGAKIAFACIPDLAEFVEEG